jgi:hypothetical protein
MLYADMKKWFVILFPLMLSSLLAEAQSKGGYLVPFLIENGDTVPVYTKADVNISWYVEGDMLQKQKYWQRLMRNVRIVMPYAKTCSMKMDEINMNMEKMPRRERKKYLKEEEKKLKLEFKSKLEDLSVDQGKLLIKLIDRETGHSSYSLIKEYKSGFTAFVWNSVAYVCGMSLKDKYDPVDKDSQVEYVVRYLGYN